MKKVFLLSLLGVVTFGLVVGSAAHIFLVWRGAVHYGTAKEIRKGSITIAEREEHAQTFNLITDVPIYRGSTNMGAVRRRAPVVVVTTTNGGSESGALIRIMETEEEARNRPK